MSERVESGVGLGESEVQIEPELISTDERDEQTSQTELDEQISEHIRQEVERRFQSAKDKRWAQLEKLYGHLHELSERAGAGSPEAQVSYGESLEGEFIGRAARLLERVGLSNDPEAVSLLQDQSESLDGGDYLDLMEDLVAITLRRVGREAAPATAVVQPGGGIAPVEDLQGAYEQHRKKLRPGDVNGLMALKKEFREKGMDVDVSSDVPADANGAFIYIYPPIGGQYSVGFRKNGTSDDNYKDIGRSIFGWVAIDDNRVFEQKIEDVGEDLFLWGYTFEYGVSPDIFGASLGVIDPAIGLYDTRFKLRARNRDTALTTRVRNE